MFSVLYWFRSCPRAVRAGCSLCFHVSPPPGLPSLSSRSSSSLLPSVSSSTCSYARFVRLPFASLRFSSVLCRFPSLHGGAVSMVRWSSLPDPPSPPWAATEWRQQRASPQPSFADIVAAARQLPVSAPQRASPQPSFADIVAAVRRLSVSAPQRGPPQPSFADIVACAQCWSVPDAERALRPWTPSASPWRLKRRPPRRWSCPPAAPAPR